MYEGGIEHFRDQADQTAAKGAGSQLPGARHLTRNSLSAVSKAIIDFRLPYLPKDSVLAQRFENGPRRVPPGRRGPRPVAFTALKDIPEDVIALLSLQAVFDRLLDRPKRGSKPATRQDVAFDIAARLEPEAQAGAFRCLHEKTVDAIKAKHRGEPWTLRLKLTKAMEKRGLAWDAWDRGTQLKLGMFCLDLVRRETGLVRFEKLGEAYGYMEAVAFSDDTARSLEAIQAAGEDLHPRYRPMVYRPAEWTNAHDGGYLNKALLRRSLISARHPDQLADVNPVVMPEVFRAVNAIQAVPWRINRRLLAVMQRVWRMGGDRLRVLPPEKDGKGIPRHVRRRHEAKRRRTARLLAEARTFADEERFFLPVHLDFRGRVYYTPFLNCQGEDPMRALFDFAEPRKIENPLFLLGAGAALFGPKARHADRVRWALQHIEKVKASAADPLHQTWWTEAKEPWQFLRWCMEINEADVRPAGSPDIPLAYGKPNQSHLPVFIDATCNGVQHLACLLRDETVGAAVNLADETQPRDVYDEVARALVTRLEGSSEAMARKWLTFGVDRDVVKPSTMTLPYGAEKWGYAETVQEKIEDRILTGKCPFDWKSANSAARWLSAQVWQVIEAVLPKCLDLLEWLKGEVAQSVAGSGQQLEWRAPSGFLVRQRDIKAYSVKVEPLLASGDKIQLRRVEPDPGGAVDVAQAKRGLVPNLVHSLDAATLCKTVCHCLAPHTLSPDGITSFAVVHDAFAVHAPHLPSLRRAFRQALAEVHADDLLARYHRQFSALLPDGEALPEPPARGGLAIVAIGGNATT